MSADAHLGDRSRVYGLALALVIAVALGRIVLSYGAVSQTIDEGSQTATGVEWLDQGTYLLNQENPPLARIANALGPVLSGAPAGDTVEERVHVLDGDAPYPRTLYLARLGALPFFIAAALVTWWWGLRWFGPATGLAAALAFTTLPLALAHAGLATTDMAAAGTFAAALFAFTRWLETPSRGWSLALGVFTASALLTKFTAVLYLAVAAIPIVGLWLLQRSRRPAEGETGIAFGRLLRGLALGACVLAILLWAGYRFSLGAIRSPEQRPYVFIDQLAGDDEAFRDFAYAVIEAPVFPAPEFFGGIGQMLAHRAEGHIAYLLGETNYEGFWLFYPVVFAVKTPLPFLAFLALGALASLRASRRDGRWLRLSPLLASAMMFASVIPSGVNVGLRHLLPMFPLLSVVVGAGVDGALRAAARGGWSIRLGASGLALWYLVTTLAAHPAYLSYFNELAGDRPEEITVDSDLDWGQDVGKLARELRAREIDRVHLALFTRVALDRFEWPAETIAMKADERPTGWIAASLFRIKAERDVAWLDEREPVARVGDSILLFWIPE
jgi:hypothetical protein